MTSVEWMFNSCFEQQVLEQGRRAVEGQVVGQPGKAERHGVARIANVEFVVWLPAESCAGAEIESAEVVVGRPRIDVAPVQRSWSAVE